MKKTILIIAHKRTEELIQAIECIKFAENFGDHQVVVVVQDGTPRIWKILSELLPKAYFISTSYERDDLPRKCINGNMFKGLEFCFQNLTSEMVVIVEDDILVSSDFLLFIDRIYAEWNTHPRFRAVNGFSNFKPSRFEKLVEYGYVRMNYGVGWGWALPKKTYETILNFWSGEEDEHWDGIFEPYIRSGFVINPVLSRTLNIGFGPSASHTSNVDLSQISGMKDGFDYLRDRDLDSRIPYIKMRHKMDWRSDCVNVDSVSLVNRLILFQIWSAAARLRSLSNSMIIRKQLYRVSGFIQVMARAYSRRLRNKSDGF